MRKARPLRLEPLERRNLLTVMIGQLEFPSIQAAIDNATSGSQILVGDGAYAESLDISRMGSAIGRGPGSLVIRGVDSASGAVIQSTTGSALRNTSPFAGHLLLTQLTFESPVDAPNSTGIILDQVSGRIELHDLVFRDIESNALKVNELTGSLSVRSSQFIATGSDGSSIAIEIDDVQGSVVLDSNVLTDVEGTALDLHQGDGTAATFAVTQNMIVGDPNFVATTVHGLIVAADGDAAMDLTVDDNEFKNLSGRAMDIAASGPSRVQTRWSNNDVSQVQGDAAVRLDAAGTAAVALTAFDNNILNASNNGLQVSLRESAEIAAFLRNNLFLVIGDDANDQGLVFSSGQGSSGRMVVLADDNTFDTIAGNGLEVALDGATTGSFTIINNFFTGINSLGGTAAALVGNVAGSSSQITTTLHDNRVLDSGGDAYHLRQQGGVLELATVDDNTPQQQLATTNSGSPIVVTGSVTAIAENALDDDRLLLLGDNAWIDEDGDGIRQPTEAVLPFATLHLTGTETGSGTQVQRSTMSDANGRYLFGALLPGSYTVTFETQLGVRVTSVDQGDDDTVDNDFSTTTRNASVTLTADDLTLDLGVVRTWQNPRNRLDVNADGFVTSNDVLRLINHINSDDGQLPLPLPTAEFGPPPYLDPNNDGFVTPNDVLQVINFLNAEIDGEGEGEGGRANAAGLALVEVKSIQGPRRHNATSVLPIGHEAVVSRAVVAKDSQQPDRKGVAIQDGDIQRELVESIVDQVFNENEDFLASS